MPQLGPFLIQNSPLSWLIIDLDNGPSKVIKQILQTEFNPNATKLPELEDYITSQPTRLQFRAFDPDNARYFTLVITSNLEILRYRPANHDLFLNFQFDESHSQLPSLFLEKYTNSIWMHAKPQKSLLENIKINYISLRDELETSLKGIIRNQYIASHEKSDDWDNFKENISYKSPHPLPELQSNGFYFILHCLKSSCQTSTEYIDAIKFVLNIKGSKNGSANSYREQEVKEQTINLLRYFYDVNLHLYRESKDKDPSTQLDRNRFIAMQQALFNEVPFLIDEPSVSFEGSIGLRHILFPPKKLPRDPYEAAKTLFLCRASNQYILGLGLSVEENYLVDNYGHDLTAMRLILSDVIAMTHNKESHWDIQDCFEVLLTEECPDYNPMIELRRLEKKLYECLDYLLKKSVQNYLKKTNERNFQKILPHILNLHDLKVALEELKTPGQQLKLIRKLGLINSNNEPIIATISDLKKIACALYEDSYSCRALIFNSLHPEAWGEMAQASDDLNFLFTVFTGECQEILVRKNIMYFAKLLQTDADILTCFNSIGREQLCSILEFVPPHICSSFLQTHSILLAMMNSDEDMSIDKLSDILSMIPSPNKVGIFKHSSATERESFFQAAPEPHLRVYLKSLSLDEWRILSATPEEIQLFIHQMAEASDDEPEDNIGAQKFINCIPKNMKDLFYKQLCLAAKPDIMKPTIPKNFETLKKTIDQRFNPVYFPVLLAIWSPSPTPFNLAENITDLQHAILDNFCLHEDNYFLCLEACYLIKVFLDTKPLVNDSSAIESIRMPTLPTHGAL
ncbi:MAG: hypothetical protein P1U74_01030 [Legionellaceae bacterium]|nr:hypothetical protein [Legionellaceae bacterium]